MRRPAIGGALHKTVFPVKYRSAVQVPSQRTASAIAARCISTCSALHPAHRPSAILTAPAIQRLRNKPAAPSHQVSKPFQTSPSAPPIPLQVHPSPTAQQSPPLSYFHTKPSLITTHQRQTPNPELGSPDKAGGEIPQTKRKVIHLHHEHTRTFSIGAVDSAIRDTFKL